MVKEQIIEFNRLLAEQVKMTQQFPSAIASLPMSNGCNISPMHQNSTCGAAENVGTAAKPNGIMHEPVRADRPNAFSNSSSSVLSCIQTAVFQDCDLTLFHKNVFVEGIYLLFQYVDLIIQQHVHLTVAFNFLPHEIPLLKHFW
ncbi:hypothetical protein P3S68_031665 [Capsicum galapagoense]